MNGVTVVVLSKDRPDLFERCAASVESQSHVVQKILVQNGTDNETPIRAHKGGWEVINPGKNLSFSEGNNLAAKQAIGSHLLLVNNDAVLNLGCVDALWEKRDSKICGCLIQRFDGTVDHAGMRLMNSSFGPIHMGRGLDPSQIYEDGFFPCVTFATVLVERNLWVQLEGLCEDYYYGYEDVDFCFRALEETGQMSRMCHDAVVTHNQCSTRNPREVDPKNIEVFIERWLRTYRLLDTVGITLEKP